MSDSTTFNNCRSSEQEPRNNGPLTVEVVNASQQLHLPSRSTFLLRADPRGTLSPRGERRQRMFSERDVKEEVLAEALALMLLLDTQDYGSK